MFSIRKDLFGRKASLFAVTTAMLLGGFVWFASSPAVAESTSGDTLAPKLVERLKAVRPDLPIESVATTPLAGIYALELPGGSTIYGTQDGNYLFVGDLYQLTDQALVNVTESGRDGRRQELLAALDKDSMIAFPPQGPVKATLNVFTDVDCGYCRKLHQEVPELNAMGIAVRYLAYPRAGIGSGSYDKVVSAWCAADQQTAITRLKMGQALTPATCANPVADHYELGKQMGVTGTPAIVLESGRLLPGYMPAADLAAAIGVSPAS